MVRSVTVYEALTKGGQPVCRCGFDDQRNDRSLEVPAWMFESAACDQLRLVDTPFVDCQALIELKAVLQTASQADVLQAQRDCLTAPGGADAIGLPARHLGGGAATHQPGRGQGEVTVDQCQWLLSRLKP
jgi:hypothetical protein